jgi:hypothetical protein
MFAALPIKENTMLMTTEKVSYAKRLSDSPASPVWPRRMMQQVDVSYDPRMRVL